MGQIIPQPTTLKPSPTIVLTETVGNFVKGKFVRTTDSKLWDGKKSYLIAVEDTNAPTRLYNKETKAEEDVDVLAGETVFLRGTALLQKQMEQVPVGSSVLIRYDGTGRAKKGRRPPYLFYVEIL